MHAGRYGQLAFALLFLVGCASAPEFSEQVEREGVWHGLEGKWYDLEPPWHPGSAGFTDSKFVGQWRHQGERDAPVALRGDCGKNEPGLRALAVPYHINEPVLSTFSRRGQYTLYFIQAPELDERVLRTVLSACDIDLAYATVDPFVTKIGPYDFEVARFGSFAEKHKVLPATAGGPKRQFVELGHIDPPFYFALASPDGRVIYVGHRDVARE